MPLRERGPAVTRLRRLVKRAVDGGVLRRNEAIVVAVSGGPDSAALLDVLARLAPPRGWRLLCVHVDHGVRAGSALEADHVAAMAASCGVDFRAVTAQLPERGSPQDRYRRGRYAALQAVAREEACTAIATGHTGDDQAETVLMRVLSGAPLASLSAMAGRTGAVARPLLSVWRSDTVAYCAALGLTVLHDPSNQDPRYLRSRVRHELLPVLETVYPAVRRRLVALAEQQRLELQRSVTGAITTTRSDTAGGAETAC